MQAGTQHYEKSYTGMNVFRKGMNSFRNGMNMFRTGMKTFRIGTGIWGNKNYQKISDTYTQNKILTIIQLIHRGIKLLKQGDIF